MHILLDCDGVLSDLRKHVIDILRLDIDPDAPAPYHLSDWLPQPQVKEAEDLMTTGVFWATLPEIKDATKGVSRLREMGHRLTVVTSPYLSCPMWGHARYLWLHERFDISPDDVIIGNRKESVMGDIFIDDKEENVRPWIEVHQGRGAGFLFDAPHNRECATIVRLDWKQIVKLLDGLPA